jgi:hypothetical protein
MARQARRESSHTPIRMGNSLTTAATVNATPLLTASHAESEESDHEQSLSSGLWLQRRMRSSQLRVPDNHRSGPSPLTVAGSVQTVTSSVR